MSFFQSSSQITDSHFTAIGRDQYNLHIEKADYRSEDDNTLASLQPVTCPYIQPCMSGTRQWMIDQIDDWLVDTQAPNVLLLTGSPGAGKSALASTLVSKLQEVGRLGASFSCKRDDVALGDPAACWRTVAFALAQFDPAIAKRIAENIRGRKVDPGRADIVLHFKYLIEDPLREAWRTHLDNLAGAGTTDGAGFIACFPVVVLDALDECGSDSSQSAQRETFIHTLSKWACLPRSFKLVITSRDHRIPKSFRNVCRCAVLNTGNIAEPEAINDIRVFLRVRFATIAENNSYCSNWPGEHIIEQLTRHAAGLFIWADTLVKFIEPGIPNIRLDMILRGQFHDEHERLDGLYRQVIDLSLHPMTPRELEIYKLVVGTIVIARIPLQRKDLQCLLDGVVEKASINGILEKLSCVISTGTTNDLIHVSHLSFAEFICDPTRCGEHLAIHRGRHEKVMVIACLQSMQTGLCFNICRLETSYVRNIDVPDLASRIEKFIPTHLSYSCRFWADHLQYTIVDIGLINSAHEFMHTHLLHWLEVLSLINEANIAPQALIWVQKSFAVSTLT